MNRIDIKLNNEILSLYEKYGEELCEVRRKAIEFSNGKTCMLPHRTTEMLYLLIRERKPDTIIEFSPHQGWSTFWMLEAVKKNSVGMIYSFDLVDYVVSNFHDEISNGQLKFFIGDVTKNLSAQLIDRCSFFYIDSAHDTAMAEWYKVNILDKKIKTNSLVIIDDIFHVNITNEESVFIQKYLNNNSIKFGNFDKYLFPSEFLRLSSLPFPTLPSGGIFDCDGSLTTIFIQYPKANE